MRSKPYCNAAYDGSLLLIHAGLTYLYGLEVANRDASDHFVQCFDAAATGDVTLGTTVPNQSFLIPAGDGASAYGLSSKAFATPITFKNGLVVAVTTTPTGSTAPTSDQVLNANYGVTSES